MKILVETSTGRVVGACCGDLPKNPATGYSKIELSAENAAFFAANKGAKFKIENGTLVVVEPAKLPVPAEVGSGQIRAALIAKGVAANDDALSTAIEAAITAAVADATQRAIAITLWRNASTFKRAHPFVAVVKAALNKDDAWVDDLFRVAATF